MIKRNDLVCLKGSYSGQELLDERNGMWSLPHTKHTIRLLSQLFNLARRIATKEDCNEFLNFWNITFKLLMMHTNYMKSKTSLANCVVHDITELFVFHIIRRQSKLSNPRNQAKSLSLLKIVRLKFL